MQGTRTTEAQRVDIKAIREMAQRQQVLAPQVIELCDLVEGSTLLEDAETARLEMAFADAATPETTEIDPEDILPKIP